MPRMPAVLAAILGRRPTPEPPLPVPPPAATVAPRPPYRTCKACGVGWRGHGGCWNCGPSPQPIPSQQEEP